MIPGNTHHPTFFKMLKTYKREVLNVRDAATEARTIPAARQKGKP